ncbi:ovochymase-like [Oppia nitens]|uniref:ovochymase-like n=1 Tax=Oppia nitens TaxID=1686743 RepID=UPI0023DC670B|nr:ovochymase-like [Oppia nitens]
MIDLKLNLFILFIAFNLNLLSVYTYDDESDTNADITRMIGGRDANPKAYPWMAQLNTTFSNYINGCGGSIIDKQWVLTAAHCVYNKNVLYKQVSVGLGKHKMSDNQHDKTVYLAASDVIVYPGYVENGSHNDIALIKLNETLDFDDKHSFLQKIDLIKPFYTINGSTCVATGWGMTKNNEISSDILQEADLSIIDSHLCDNRLILNNKSRIIDKNTELCAFNPYKRVCMGDSGGPLSCKLYNLNKWVIVGVASFTGLGCQIDRTPGIYTNVEAYLDWIDKSIKTDKLLNSMLNDAKTFNLNLLSVYTYDDESDTNADITRMIGGRDADIKTYPWMAVFGSYFHNIENITLCGGSIIDKQWILTAAHCYCSSSILFWKKINLPKSIYPINFNSCVATGWGKKHDNETNSDILQVADLSILDPRKCDNALKLDGKQRFINENTELCAHNSNKRICEGDSGGPLNCKVYISNKWVVVGVASFTGLGCNIDNTPGIYTKVSAYLPWINDTIITDKIVNK